ncbi:MAG: integrase core domain-containing protein [Rhizomicrobium sp.]
MGRGLRSMGIRDRPITLRSPWQNGYVERAIGSIRRECLDHIIVWSEAHLRRVLNAYVAYYNVSRTQALLQFEFFAVFVSLDQLHDIGEADPESGTGGLVGK